MLHRVHGYSGLHVFYDVILFVGLAITTAVISAHEESEDGEAGRLFEPAFTTLLPDVPGKRITVYAATIGPRSETPPPARDHHHTGSVYIYVVRGSVRWGMENEPVQTLYAGDSFFEPPQVLHTVAENASTTEPATVLVVMLHPDGEPVTIFD